MPDVDREEAVRYIIDGLDPKPFRAIWDRLPQIVGSMIEYDLHFMRLTGVIAPDGGPGPNEYDEDEEELIQKMSEDTYLVEGSMKLDDINDVLGTNLTSEDYDSIGGLIIDCLDRLPEDGEEVTLENGIHLKVQGIDQNRIIKVLMTIPEPNEEHVEHSSETSENHE